MVNKLARLTAEQRDSFVAYLDGELDEQKAQEIERLLAQNEVARHDVESLAATWELLDAMPTMEAPHDFASKTMATAKLEQTAPPLQEQAWFLQSKRLTLLLAGWTVVVVCAVGGFLLARSVPPSDNDVLINNYSLIHNLDEYQEVGSIDFLERLQRSVAWTKRNRPSANTEARR